jgi:hypothetical protein
VLLGAGVVLVVVFLVAQGQTAEVSYGRSPSGAGSVREGDAGELTEVALPSVAEMAEMVARDPVVRLPGAVAVWDEGRVAAAIGGADIRVLVAPPGLSEAQEERVREVAGATILVMGTEVVGSVYEVVPDDLATWRASFVTGDITGLLLTLVAAEKEEPDPPEVTVFEWRVPSAAELGPVVADLRGSGLHVAEGATLRGLPSSAGTAFGGRAPVVAAFPRQPHGGPVAEYGPVLAELFPDTPVVVMYGSWVGYYGPHAGGFADVAGAGFYARFGGRLSRYEYPQGNVLGTFLNGVTDVRYAGLFDRPLPYRPFDPLRVALPVLPWLFVVCVVGFLVLSVRRVVGSGGGPPRRPSGRLAGLTTLAVELSALSHAPALTRALGGLAAARSALAEELPDRQVSRLLSEVEGELDAVARALGRVEYRPVNYLAGGLS